MSDTTYIALCLVGVLFVGVLGALAVGAFCAVLTWLRERRKPPAESRSILDRLTPYDNGFGHLNDSDEPFRSVEK